MTGSGSVVDMAPFWTLVAVPAATAVLVAAGYVLAAWRWPALRTPVASWRVWQSRRGHIEPWIVHSDGIPVPAWRIIIGGQRAGSYWTKRRWAKRDLRYHRRNR